MPPYPPPMLSAASGADPAGVPGIAPAVPESASATGLTAWLHAMIGNDMAAQVVGMLITVVAAVVIYLGLRRGLVALLDRNHQLLFLAERLLRWTFVPLVLLLMMQQMGIELGNLWTLVSATLAMVAIGFVAVWSVLSNISATFMIFSTRLFTVGDEVEILEPTAADGLRGRVVDLNLVYTTIEQASDGGVGRIVTKIPNNIFFQKCLRIRSGGAELPVRPATGSHAPSRPG